MAKKRNPLTRQRLRNLREREAAVRLRYGPQEQELQGQVRASDQRQSDIAGWYQDYLTRITAAQNSVHNIYAATGQQIQDQISRNADTDTSQFQALGTTAQKDAELRGANPPSMDQAAQAASSRRALQSSFGAMLAGQGANNETSLVNEGRIAAGQKVQTHLGESKRRNRLVELRGKLQADKGAYRADWMRQRREDDWKRELEGRAYDLDVAEFQQGQADDALDAQTAAGEVNQYGYTDEEWRGLSTGERQQIILDFKSAGSSGSKEDKGPTASEVAAKARRKKDSNKAVTRINDARGRWDLYAKQKIQFEDKDGNPQTRNPTPDDIRARLVKEGYSTEEIHLALMIRAGKPLTQKDIKTAHRLGIRIPRSWLGPKAPKPPKYDKGSGPD